MTVRRLLHNINTQPQRQSADHTIMLVGNPNCGKTTLFNGLTGTWQKVGNWPGVTVERKTGYFTANGTTIEVIDLPGVYSLTLASQTAALDERIAVEAILSDAADVVVNIVDASNLERHLYLTMQLLEMDTPLILALNMMDVAEKRGMQIDILALSQALKCPVIATSAHKGLGLEALKEALQPVSVAAPRIEKMPLTSITYPPIIHEAINALSVHAIKPSLAVRLLESDAEASAAVSPSVLHEVCVWQQRVTDEEEEDADILIADARYRHLNQIVAKCVVRHKQTKSSQARSAWLDAIVLNRVLSLPIFLAVMYALFFFAINIGGAFQDFFDISSQTIFVDGLTYALTQLGSPTWLTILLGNGIGKGINTTITFIPIIGAMFLFLSFLEDSGYMARAAFVVDRFMRTLGLPGKAFVPMIVGFGCNVPAVMGARTLENKHDRILTIMMAPFMSCGARLAIFAVFTAAFFPQGGQNVVFALYLIGIVMAVVTGFILRRTVLKGEPSRLVMELPPYHMPHIKTLLLHAWQRLKSFVFRAGRLIVPICVIIGALNSFNLDGSMNAGVGDIHSLLSLLGQWITPIFAPMGVHADNWPATVGLLTGVLAKEVVIGTLNTLYSQMGHLTAANSDFHLWAGLQEAWQSIPANFAALTDAFSNPVLAKAPIDPVNQGVLGLMYQQFDGKIGAFAYLLKNINETFKHGDNYLLKGVSGIGKSTFIRALAGIWPYAKGEVFYSDRQKMMYLPQKPYMPIGTLQEAILFPDQVHPEYERQLPDILRACHLEQFIPRLQETALWSEQLSPGEQQRIAFARILLQKPDWVFLDESTSMLDLANEEYLYQLLEKNLAKCSIISVGHRPSLEGHHDHVMNMEKYVPNMMTS